MTKTVSVLKNEKGFVLALAMFMLAMLGFIGIASMMTSTTEIDIAGNEKAHKSSLYVTETGLAFGGEVIEWLQGYDVVSNDFDFNGNPDVKIKDGTLFAEGRDTHDDDWNYGDYTDDPAVDKITDKEGAAIDNQSDIEIRLADFTIDLDVDKIRVKHLVGSGTEFSSGAEGIGVSSHKVIYNVDSIGRLPQNPTIRSEIVFGYRFIPK